MAASFRKLPTVMVVDDAFDSAEMTAKVLQLAGYEVRIAFDGQQALEEIAASCPDVVLMDIDMPRVDGYAAARSIRGELSACDPLLLALTAKTSAEDKERAFAAGFDAHLSKPLFGSALVTALEDAIAAADFGAPDSGDA